MNHADQHRRHPLALAGYAGALTFAVTVLATDWEAGPVAEWSLVAALVIMMFAGTALSVRAGKS
ncbi:hypothetical protein [Streptomyces sp. WM6378]|uniref:hypothetical protein n=1 Tax=Streptomyces sp. WM6378 TaxID=1415557 RepID=UPI0006ADB4F6|nr:hypothetical protein [Streptomyces sp. WM6378]KOU43562.1 hypothetical protein ADK54_17355 [Streptomyces sp. WM6378]